MCDELELLPQSARALDNFLADYGNLMFASNKKPGCRQRFFSMVTGVKLLLSHLKTDPRRARALFGGWDRQTEAESHPSFPHGLVATVGRWFGKAIHGHLGLRTLLSFHALLGVGELCRFGGGWTWCHQRIPLFLPDDGATAGVLVWRGKTGPKQFIPILDEKLTSLLLKARDKATSRAKVVPNEPAQYQRALAFALRRLNSRVSV